MTVPHAAASRQPFALVTQGAFAGCLVAALDAISLSVLQGRVDLDPLAYALAVDALAGAALGAFVAVLVGFGTMLRRALGRSFAGFAPAAAVAAGTVVLLNRDLFEGPWIREQGFQPAVRLAFFILAPGLAMAAVPVAARLSAARASGRGFAAVAALGAAALFAWFDLRLFGAYPRLKIQLACATMLLGGFAIHLIWPRRPVSISTGPAAVAVVLGAVCCAAAARATDAIHALRTAIVVTPWPATQRAMGFVEPVLDLVLPLDESWQSSRVAEVFIAAADAASTQRALDDLAPRRRSYNVLWIAVDALRQDHLGYAGATDVRTPFIDRLARRSVRFRRAVAPSPSSALCYSSLFDGLQARLSSAYHVRHGLPDPWPDDHAIPAVFRASGRRTTALMAFHQATTDAPEFRTLRAGFDAFDVRRTRSELTAEQVTDEGLRLLDEQRILGQPFFMWLHYVDPHAPYLAHPEFGAGTSQHDRYVQEIAYCDAHIGRLLRGLEDLGLDDDTIVCLFGDHGESFGEHNTWHHGASLYEEQVRVPLLVAMPGVAAREVSRWVSLADLGPTTLALCGIRDPYRRLGRDLTPLMIEDAEEWVDNAYLDRPASPRAGIGSLERGVVSGDLKLIEHPGSRTTEVYDLSSDPAETRNVFDPSDPRQSRLVALLNGWEQRLATFYSGVRDAEQARDPSSRLRARVTQLRGARAGEDIARILHQLLADLSAAREADVDLDANERASLRSVVGDRLREAREGSEVQDLARRVFAAVAGPGDLGALREECERSGRATGRLALLCARGRLGDVGVRGELRAALAEADFASACRIARALAALGDAAGHETLTLALDAPGMLRRTAVAGLTDLADPGLLDRLLLALDPAWRAPWLLETVADAVIATDTFRAACVGSMLAASAPPATARRVRAALERRGLWPGETAIRRVADTAHAIRDGIRYRRFHLSLRAAERSPVGDDRWLGVTLWHAARAARETGRRDRAAEFLERLAAVTAGDVDWRPAIERLRDALDGADAGAASLEVRLLDRLPETETPRGAWIRFVVEVRNGAGGWFPGGPWQPATHLGISFAREPGGVESALSVAPIVPLAGLAPAEVRRFVLVAPAPAEVGRYTVCIATGRRPGATPERVLARFGGLVVR